MHHFVIVILDQGFEESDVLLLKRRYFYSDRNVDGGDPVQLNLHIQLRIKINLR